MKESYKAEIQLMFFSALSGIVMWQGGWFILIGFLFLLLASYFLTSNLKRYTIEEYLDAVKKKKRK